MAEAPSGENGQPPSQVEIINNVKGVLENAQSAEGDVISALSKLESLGVLPTKVLRETMVGKSVNTLAKTAKSDGIRNKARTLVASWRTEVQSKKRKSSDNLDDAKADKLQRSVSGATALSESQESTLSLERTDSTISMTSTGGDLVKANQKRLKVREKILEALGKQEAIEAKDGDDKDDGQMKDFDSLASEIEEELWKKFKKDEKPDGEVDEKGYMNQARSFLYNLKDSKNTTFRLKVAVGFIKPHDIPGLNSEQMASDEKNEARKKMREDAMAEIDQGWALKNGAARISGMFTCGKCKGTKTTYFQMQTRSSDEPMTTFVTCLTCSNRWKFC